jgi:hypothetical protein
MLQKYKKKKVAIKIGETCEKTMFTPSNPITLALHGLEEPFFIQKYLSLSDTNTEISFSFS